MSVRIFIHMDRTWESRLASWASIAVAMSMLLTLGCRGSRQPDGKGAELSGEPDQYSATVVRIVEDGTSSQTIISREARSREQRREEWTENGHNRALIWRPDIGKAYLLDLDRRTYVEIDVGSSPESKSASGNPRGVSAAKRSAADSIIQATDQYFSDKQPPTRVETRALSSVSIDGHACEVTLQTTIFSDGHTETIRSFRAIDLSGLLLRVESEGVGGRTRVITERRNVQLGVEPGTFTVPSDFKKLVSSQ